MNASTFAALGLAVAALGAASATQARDVYWSVDIEAPIYPAGRIGTSFSNAPRPVYAAPVVVMPQPVYVQPRVVYLPPPVMVRERVVYRDVVRPYPVYAPYPVHKGKWKHAKHRRHHDDDDDDD